MNFWYKGKKGIRTALIFFKSPILTHFEAVALCLFTKCNNIIGVWLIWGLNLTNFDTPRYKLNNLTDSNDYFSSIFQNKLGETSKEFIIQESYEPNCVVGLCGDFSSGSAGFKSELFSSILISLSIILMTVKWMNFFKALFYFIYKVDLTRFN